MYISFSETGVSTYPVRHQPTSHLHTPCVINPCGFPCTCGYRSCIYLPHASSTHIFVRVVYTAKCVAISIKTINFIASELCFCTFSVASGTITPPFSDATRKTQVDGARGCGERTAVFELRRRLHMLDVAYCTFSGIIASILFSTPSVL